MSETNSFLKEMGKRIANRRNNLDLTQEQLAEKADVTSQMLSTAERGAKALRPENLLKISNALGVSVDYLLTGKLINIKVSDFSTNQDELSEKQKILISEIIERCIQLSNIK